MLSITRINFTLSTFSSYHFLSHIDLIILVLHNR